MRLQLPKPYVFATDIPGRSPQMKVHRREGDAKSAITNAITMYGRFQPARQDMVMWKLVDGEWQEYLWIRKGTYAHELPWKKDD